jgi:hypothetical protein
MSDWLIGDLERILRRLRGERRADRARDRYEQTLREVEAFLARHPEASANVVYSEIGGRRQDVLRAARAVRARFPSRGNHQMEAGL